MMFALADDEFLREAIPPFRQPAIILDIGATLSPRNRRL